VRQARAGSTGIGLAGFSLARLVDVVDAPPPVTVLGFDVGGTSVRGALAGPAGEIRAETAEPTRGATSDALLDQLAALAVRLADEAGTSCATVDGVGLGVPGIVDPAGGAVGLSPNVPGVEGTDLHRRLSEVLGVPVEVDNDVNLAAAGEFWCGAARGEADFVLLNVGTGIGAGLVLGGELYRGRHGGAGELAHLPLDHTGYAELAQVAAYERSVSPSGLMRRWAELAASAAPTGSAARAVSAASATARTTADVAGPEALLDVAEQGDPVASQALDEEVRLLATGLAAVNALLDPGLVVVGGGLGANPVLVARVGSALSAAGLPLSVVPSALRGRGGLAGALLLGCGAARAAGAAEAGARSD